MTSQLQLILLSAIVGAVLSYLAVVIRRRRGLFTYVAVHNTAAISTSDPIFGTIEVTWQGNAVTNLYSSTVELHNRSPSDYEDIEVRIFSTNTRLLAEKTEILETTNIIEYTTEYRQKIHVEEGAVVSQNQIDLYSQSRDFLIPIFNRGQKCRFSFLSSTHDQSVAPTIWLEVIHRGVKCEYRGEPQLFWGVSQPLATLVGFIVGIALVALMLDYVSNPMTAAIVSFLIGAMVLVPGAITLKVYYWIRAKLVG